MTFHCCCAQKRDTRLRSTGLGELPASCLVGSWRDVSISVLLECSEWLVAVVSAWWRRTLGVLGEMQPYNSVASPTRLKDKHVGEWMDREIILHLCHGRRPRVLSLGARRMADLVQSTKLTRRQPRFFGL